MRRFAFAYAMVCIAAHSTPAMSEGSVGEGEKVFQRCASCHSVGAEDPNRKGPSLKGVVGRPVASTAGYSYSAPMAALGASGAKWDEATLDQFLKYPSEFVKGTTMTAPPVRREAERADLIAYLATIH
jgi:cytochrome c2